MDIDEYDTMENPYKQLIVWNPEAEEILGGYRYILGTDVRFDEHGAPVLATSHMFNFSGRFVKEFLPTTIDIGRSFVIIGISVNPVPGARGYLLWIICGTDWGH